VKRPDQRLMKAKRNQAIERMELRSERADKPEPPDQFEIAQAKLDGRYKKLPMKKPRR
jgi:hypothetical protein